MSKVTTYLSVAALASAAFISPLVAAEQGDWIVRVGAANVDPDVSSDPIDIAGLVTLDGVDVDDDTQLGITGTYMVRDKWGVSLLAATPFEHDITVKGVGIAAGSAKQLPPTLTLQWYPRGGSDGWQPYLGLGVNYTAFFDEEVDSELEAALGIITEPVTGSTAPVPASLDLENSWGVAVQAGVDIPINDKWAVNAGVWWIDIGTTATIGTALGDVKFDVDLDPWVYMIGVAYKF
jgi:outer membrane protein